MPGMGCTVQWLPSHRSATVDGGPVFAERSPTAVHADDDEQETPLKKSPVPPVPEGVTVGWIVQAVPFQRSASNPVSVFPTAMQARAVHATAPRKLFFLCEVGDGWRVQVVPFHRSATVPTVLLNELSTAAPTATQTVADVHDTPVRKLFGAPAGAGMGWTVQLFPSHRSAMTAPALLVPTDVHADGDVHETAFRSPPALVEVGVGWMFQLVPFQRSVSVPTGLPELPKPPPTATQFERAVHETPLSALRDAPSAFGVGTIRHDFPLRTWARVPLGLPDGESLVPPTATQNEDDLHDTPASCAPCIPRGLIVGCKLHRVPFHRCPTVTEAPEASTPEPTATQSEAFGQATPTS